ncbi:hypothetical protein EUGRSUZ_L02031 [Eucalyptus grandis]|uniref:Uncharacterized protein n=3 Tax=Eucalyptus grandis TaxID=71139 RepID=A0AAD9TAM9_EUCGR|nr:hypothetical protein EUGRSUZ_L02031 [Eucalyptus grandis]
MSPAEAGGDDYTQDGTVDLRGNPVRRSKRGRWTACSFIVVYEVFERMAYFGISSNLVVYLTTKLHQGTVQSANNVTNWVGTSWITPILGAYVADAHLGRYWTFVIGSGIYLAGMLVLTLAVSLRGLKPPPCSATDASNCKKASLLQLAVFYGGLYTLVVGTSGTKPNISTIGADQFDDFDTKEKAHKLSFFDWWMFSVFFGTLFGNTVLVYIQDDVGRALGYGLPTLALAVAIAIFLAGTPRFLNKACVRTGSTSLWKLSSVTQVEETKQMLRMIPILLATFVPSCMMAQINTLFVKQGTTLDRSMGSFKIPPASLAGFTTASMLVCIVVYDRVFVKIMRRWTKNPRGISLLQRMGIGLLLHIMVMTVASFTERWRLRVAREHGLVESGGQIPLTIFILLPQFVLMGVADGFLEVAKMEFFYDQVPESMKSLGTSYAMATLGIGNFISSFLLSTVSRLTERNGHHGWILDNLNASRLDYYYAFFAVLTLLNFAFFLFVAKHYVYRAEVSDSMAMLEEELKGAPWIGQLQFATYWGCVDEMTVKRCLLPKLFASSLQCALLHICTKDDDIDNYQPWF